MKLRLIFDLNKQYYCVQQRVPGWFSMWKWRTIAKYSDEGLATLLFNELSKYPIEDNIALIKEYSSIPERGCNCKCYWCDDDDEG